MLNDIYKQCYYQLAREPSFTWKLVFLYESQPTPLINQHIRQIGPGVNES